MKRLAGYTAVVLATVTVAVLLFQFRQVLVLFLLSLLLAAALRPLYQRLVDRGVEPRIALALIFIAVLLLGTGLLLAIGRPLLNDLQTVAGNLIAGYESAYVDWKDGTMLQQLAANRLPAPEIFLEAMAGAERGGLLANVANLTERLLGAAGALVAIFVISIYWMADRTYFERIWLGLLPAKRRAGGRMIWRTVENELGAYIRSEIVQSAAAAALLGLGYWLIGLPQAMLLAVLGGFAWFIPLVGSLFVVAPVLLIGLSYGQPLALAAGVIYALLVLVFLEYVVEPRLFDRRHENPILALFIMLMLTQEFGLLGLVIAPPLAVAAQLLFTQSLLRRSRQAAQAEAAAEQLENLRQRLVRLSASIDTGDEDDIAQKRTNLAQRLADLMQQAQEVFANEAIAES